MEKQITIHYEEYTDWSQLVESERNMVEKAYSMCENAYAPYSNFHVGATVLLSKIGRAHV